MLNRIMKEREEWANRNFDNQQAYQMLLGIVEEVGELSHSHLKQDQKIRENENHLLKAKDAVGDIMIFLLGYCSLRGFNPEEILQETWNEVKQRDWKRNPNTGGI